MRVSYINLKKQFSYGDGLKKEVGIEMHIEPLDDPFRAMRAAEKFVDYHDPSLDRIKQKETLESIISDPYNFTQKEILDAKNELDKLKKIENQFTNTTNQNNYKESTGPVD